MSKDKLLEKAWEEYLLKLRIKKEKLRKAETEAHLKMVDKIDRIVCLLFITVALVLLFIRDNAWVLLSLRR